MADPSKLVTGRGGGCLPVALVFLLAAIPACLTPKAEPWDPRPAILEQAFERFPRLDATDLDWSGPEPLADTGLETWVLEGPYKHGWLVTGWTVDPNQQTVRMDWSRTEELR